MQNHGFGRILLATDGSQPAKAAEGVAAAFAHPSRALVRVVHVWNMEVHQHDHHWDVETHREAKALIHESVMRLHAVGVEADGELCNADSDRIASSVAEAARRFDADLVVIGARGLSDWQSLIKHSVSHELLTAVDCPVLVVGGHSTVPKGDARRVLLAVAGGSDVAPAVRAAIAAAASAGSRVLVVHVAQAIFGAYGFGYVEPEEEIKATLTAATSMLQAAGIQTEAFVAGKGQVAEVIARSAAEWEADVIVIGSSRSSDVSSILFGSVTHELMRNLGRPVLVADKERA